ncbi:hypothetical protein GCM10010441_68740 [Kitasatospora paracochleata]|uniref:DUF3103 family protein n=1 Tax=Kitasatospora paracochleata TaxID=58354 RepID=A0ABT1IVI2_9ACTN|nr:DUF3103 family protein [Kitasatospora paracochleata]MCP2309132.1 hypothetical protein [Kitasatospora paracochleata]
MPLLRPRRAAVAAAVLALTGLAAGQAAAVPAATAPASARPTPLKGQVAAAEDRVARDLAVSLADAGWSARVRSAVGTGPAGLAPLAAGSTARAAGALARSVADGDRSIAAAKGLDAGVGPLLRVQLADPSMRAALDAGAAPLVAVAVADEHARTIRAYDSAGRVHTLDAARVPAQPVYLVDLDGAKALAAGTAVLQKEFADRGLTGAQAAGGWWGTKIDGIEVNDDQEPWFKGAAEMFSLVSGFGQDGKVRVDSVAMPYLQYDKTVYYPNQILVNWSNYKYNLADVVLMEDDGDTNYLALAQAVAAALLTIADQGAYIPLVNAVLGAMPSSWWTDDPDYVESWYTLARTSTGRLNGASGNGWMTVEPYFVGQF